MLSTSRLLRNSLRMRPILCRQVLLQNGDGSGAMQGREGLEGSEGAFMLWLSCVGGREVKKATR